MRTHTDTRTGDTVTTLTDAEVKALKRAVPIARGIIGEIDDASDAQAVHRAAAVLDEYAGLKALENAARKEKRELDAAKKAAEEKKARKSDGKVLSAK